MSEAFYALAILLILSLMGILNSLNFESLKPDYPFSWEHFARSHGLKHKRHGFLSGEVASGYYSGYPVSISIISPGGFEFGCCCIYTQVSIQLIPKNPFFSFINIHRVDDFFNLRVHHKFAKRISNTSCKKDHVIDFLTNQKLDDRIPNAENLQLMFSEQELYIRVPGIVKDNCLLRRLLNHLVNVANEIEYILTKNIIAFRSVED